ncbi:MAG: glycosyl transferase family 2 [Firmicutes bacterium]|nr:glycosyl transferase family 2 [Bacillota bacterium]
MDIAILIPCYNEELTIQKVIGDFKAVLPEATVYVYDNNSTDKSAELAQSAGAVVINEYYQGKGNVVRSMFRNIDADVYVLVDGDDTYPASAIAQLIQPVIIGISDMTVGDRLSNNSYKHENKRNFHCFGNQLVRGLINQLFGADLKDIMSGYRVFNKRFVKLLPILSSGFELETEITLHALDKRYHIQEIPIMYKDRPIGSVSKLNTFSDGARVIKTILWIFKDYRPLMFFSTVSLFFFLLSLGVGMPVINEFLHTGFVYKVPSAVLAAAMAMLAGVALTCGLVLDTLVKQNKQNYEIIRNRRFE